eukprot:9536918-Alexandrium_andersonii.AAC.2
MKGQTSCWGARSARGPALLEFRIRPRSAGRGRAEPYRFGRLGVWSRAAPEPASESVPGAPEGVRSAPLSAHIPRAA